MKKEIEKVNFEKEIIVAINVSKNDLISFFDINNYKKVDNYVVDDILCSK